MCFFVSSFIVFVYGLFKTCTNGILLWGGSKIYKCLCEFKKTYSNIIKEYIEESLPLLLVFPVSLAGCAPIALTLKAILLRCRWLRCRFGVLILPCFLSDSPYPCGTCLIFIFPGRSFLRWLSQSPSRIPDLCSGPGGMDTPFSACAPPYPSPTPRGPASREQPSGPGGSVERPAFCFPGDLPSRARLHCRGWRAGFRSSSRG